MTLLAPHITSFLTERLPHERRASENTRESYAYAFKLLLTYAARCLNLRPSALQFEQIDAKMVLNFLGYVEGVRRNCASSRNIRLAAIKSFMHYMEYRLPSALEQIRRVLAIPTKRTDVRLVSHLTNTETQSILDAPDPATRHGVRDRAMLHVCFAAGLRVSELVGLRLDDLRLNPQPTIFIRGKGRKERTLPLWKETTTALRTWMEVRKEAPVPELFLNARGQPMTRAGFEYVLRKHVAKAAKGCPSLLNKKVSPHTLRHTCAMTILQATKDIRRVALWLGHSNIQTTEMYTRADPAIKLETLEAVVPPRLRTGRFKAADELIASLRPSTLCEEKGRKSSRNAGTYPKISA
jgi:site-specific recombinase XerD